MSYSDNTKESLGDRMRRKSVTSAASQTNADQLISTEGSEMTNVLEGDLSEKPISWLLMAAQHYEVTGRLQVGLAACSVIVQFGLGRAVHAQSPFCSGPEAIMDLFIWKDGRVRFESGRQPESVTVQETIEELIRRGEAYVGNLAFLEQHAIGELSFLVRPPARHAVGEVERRLKKGQPIDTTMQMEFYSNIYGTRNLKDTAEKLALTPSQWVSITANLLQLGIFLTPDGRSIQTVEPDTPDPTPTAEYQALRLQQAAAKPQNIANLWHTKATVNEPEQPVQPDLQTQLQDQQSVPAAKPVQPIVSDVTITPASMFKMGVPNHIITLDAADQNSVMMMLSEPDTGILKFEALQFFIAREFARACRFKTLLTLVLFSIRCAGGEGQKAPQEVRILVTGAVSRIKRDVDMFGHFGKQAFGLLLPNVDSNQACLLVDRINSDLLHLTPDLRQYNVSLHFGLASVPQDTSEVNGLVKAAQVAMFHATSNNLLRTEAQQLRQ